MNRRRHTVLALLAAVAVGGLATVVAEAPQVSAEIPNTAGVIINEVYGGGGNSGATLTHDFIELYNTTGSDINLAGWSVQYRSAAGSAWTGSTELTGSIKANGYFLIQQAQGSGGTTPLPTPDVTGTIAMSGTAGVVALAATDTTLTCSAAACATDGAVRDLVGYGPTATTFAGSAPAPVLTNTTAASRDAAHANTWDNSADFTAGTPSPETSTPPTPPEEFEGTIAEIQGTGDTSPHVGDLATTEGVVTAAYPTGGYAGFVIQTEGTGGPIIPIAGVASDAIFVASVAPVTVEPGDFVRVTGLVSEPGGLTTITAANATDIAVIPGSPEAVTAIEADWPDTDAARESIESMLFDPVGTYTVSNTFPTNASGEVGLAFGDSPLRTPTDVARPGTPQYTAAVADNLARAVTLDDGATVSFLSNKLLTPPYITAGDDTVRVGATVTFATAVIVDFRTNAWKFQPLEPVTDANDQDFVSFGDTRVDGPDADAIGDGSLRVASFNVLNYFTKLGVDVPGCTSFKDRDGNPITVNTCPGNGPRGAWDAANLKRQQDKIVAAINALDADVVGLMEIENSRVLGATADAALSTLVNALNTAAGAPVWAFVPSSTQLPPTSEMDVISNAIIYKPLTAARVGNSLALGTESSAGEAFENAREPIGQVFKPAGGGESFLVVVNHFKSKGSGTGLDADAGDGQGASNHSRVRQATALLAWTESVQASAGVDDVFLIGDFNSYTLEDPLQVLYDGGYVDANEHFGDHKQSYSFGGQNGSLDHIIVNPSALERVTGADIWNVNAPESIALEYSRYNYHGTLFYAPDAFRSSDHDPVVVGVTPTPAAQADTTDVTLISFNDFHGRIDTNTVKWAGTVAQIAASAGGADVAITAAGDLVSASLFASAVQADQPTIDVMNAIGLQASAVGNHEFDKGWPDLRDRILGGDGDPDNNAAAWDYLGANVYDSTQLPTLVPLLPEYSIIDVEGINVGVIGAVTEETPALVSPGGMVGVTIGDPVEAVNRVAAALSDGNLANGEADVLVATFHEGAPTGTPLGGTLESNLAASATFNEIVNSVSADVDVLFNGHTHQVYAWDGPVPGAPGEFRPVLQTGNYGENVGKVVLTVDDVTHDVVSYTRENVARTTTPDSVLIEAFPNLAEVKTIVDDALAYAAVIGNQPVGNIATDITTAYANGAFGPTGYQAPRINANRDQRQLESTLGNLVADALVERLSSFGATIGVVNPGGLRSELFYPTSTPLNEGDGVVTFAEANSVLPFVNNLWTTTLTGAQFKILLEQQWQRDASGNVPSRAYLQLGLSENVSYTFDPALPEGSRITSITIDGAAYDPAANYKIGTFSFLVTGGDNFRIFTEGTGAADTGLIDRDAWIDYIEENGTPPPGIEPDYSRRIMAVSPTPTTVAVGGSLQTTLSYLDLTSLGAPASTSVDVTLGGVSLGSLPVSFAAPGTAGPTNGASGTATLDAVVPASVPGGVQNLTFVVRPSGKTVTFPVTVTGTEPPLPSPPLTPVAPKRILDTRTGGQTVDDLFEGIGRREAGTTLVLDVAGRGGVPDDAIGAVVNLTATDATGTGYATVWPCDAVRPTASSVNFGSGAPSPNSVTSALAADGTICIYVAEAGVHLIADVNASIDADSAFKPINPARLADSRDGAVTGDGLFLGGGPRTAGSVWKIKVAGRGGVPTEAEVASMNVTLTDGSGTGYVTVWSCSSPMPLASSVNYLAGQTVPNSVTSLLSTAGEVCIYVAEASAHVIVDVNGYYLDGSGYGALDPARLLDTRAAPTIDGLFSGVGLRAPGQILELQVAGRGNVPSAAVGAVLNVTATDGTATGFVTVWPCSGPAPNASTVNFVAGAPRANASVSMLSDTGKVCLVVSEASAHLIVDVVGYL